MINLYFKIISNKKVHYFHSEYDNDYIKYRMARIFLEFQYEIKTNREFDNQEIKSYRERELGIFGIFIFSDKLIKNKDDKNSLERMSLLCCRVFDVLDSVDNTHGFNIDLDESNITEMDFDEVTKTMMNT